MKHTHSDIYIWKIKYCICQSGAAAQYIKACRHRQEVQLMFRPNTRRWKKCDLSDFDCVTIVGARRQFEYLRHCWSPESAQQSLVFIKCDAKSNQVQKTKCVFSVCRLTIWWHEHIKYLFVPTPLRDPRSSSDKLLTVPLSRLKFKGDRAFSVKAPKLWNLLSLKYCSEAVSETVLM